MDIGIDIDIDIDRDIPTAIKMPWMRRDTRKVMEARKMLVGMRMSKLE